MHYDIMLIKKFYEHYACVRIAFGIVVVQSFG